MMPQGMLKPYLLFLISKKPMHGFEIMHEISSKSDGIWRPGASAIYPSLDWLSQNGYTKPLNATASGEKAQRKYCITKKGEDAVKNYRKFEAEWFGSMARLRKLFS